MAGKTSCSNEFKREPQAWSGGRSSGGFRERFIGGGCQFHSIMPTRVDHNPCAHCRMPIDMMRHGWLTRLIALDLREEPRVPPTETITMWECEWLVRRRLGLCHLRPSIAVRSDADLGIIEHVTDRYNLHEGRQCPPSRSFY